MRSATILTRLEKYSVEVNTHDLYKFIALVIMTIDHLGAYLYPDYPWFRAVGRITFPVWFFLAGYARTSKFSIALLIYAVLVHVGNIGTFYPVFPLNALFSIIFCRLFIMFLQKKGTQFVHKNLFILFFLTVIWHLPLGVFFEYGGLALLFALIGHVARLRNDGLWSDTGESLDRRNLLFAAGLVCFVFMQQVDFEFDILQLAFVAVGTSLTVYKLNRFKVEKLNLPLLKLKPVSVTILLLSRYSLEYYFLHRVLLQILSLYLVPSHEYMFQWIKLN